MSSIEDKEFVIKTRINIICGLFNKAIILMCPFLLKQVLLKKLGADYLGLDSLFASILSVLSVSELGFGVAIVSNMYKPFIYNDAKHLSALINYYKKIYRIIGFVIVVLGGLLIPFLPNLIKGSYPDDLNITIVYMIFVINTAINYFLFSYMESIIIVAQRDDIKYTINTIIILAQTATQIVLLWFFENYYLYVMLLPIFTIISNIIIFFIVRKMFPNYDNNACILEDERKEIKIKTTGSFIIKACQLSRNSFDCICISAFIGLNMTAIYSNYYYVLLAMISILSIVTQSIRGGIGKHVFSESVEDNYNEFKKIDYIYMFLAGWFVVIYVCMIQPFMTIWMGKDMLLPFPVVLLLAFYFYLLKIGDIPSVYSYVKGLFWKHRYRALVETIGNLILNIILVREYGVYGIVIATIITLLLAGLIWGGKIVFDNYFGIEKLRTYFGFHIICLFVTALVTAFFYYICEALPFDGVYHLILRAVVCVVIPAMVMGVRIIYCRGIKNDSSDEKSLFF